MALADWLNEGVRMALKLFVSWKTNGDSGPHAFDSFAHQCCCRPAVVGVDFVDQTPAESVSFNRFADV
jgi:hypothetical protein